MNVVADRLPVEPTAPGFHELELAWRQNEELGASLEGGDLTSPAAIRALELFRARRRILYVHIQAHRERCALPPAMPRVVGF
jgi:hypothetical protein